jgi:hypothetical protein
MHTFIFIFSEDNNKYEQTTYKHAMITEKEWVLRFNKKFHANLTNEQQIFITFSLWLSFNLT